MSRSGRVCYGSRLSLCSTVRWVRNAAMSNDPWPTDYGPKTRALRKKSRVPTDALNEYRSRHHSYFGSGYRKGTQHKLLGQSKWGARDHPIYRPDFNGLSCKVLDCSKSLRVDIGVAAISASASGQLAICGSFSGSTPRSARSLAHLRYSARLRRRNDEGVVARQDHRSPDAS